jgi:hypothetical protein
MKCCTYIQRIHKRMERYFSPYTDTTYTVSSWNCPSFSCATGMLTAYWGAAGPVSKMASRQEKASCVPRFEASRSVITVQREFHARFRKDAPDKNVFFKPSRKLALHCSQLAVAQTVSWLNIWHFLDWFLQSYWCSCYPIESNPPVKKQGKIVPVHS